MNKPWKVILAFIGVFVAGAICGGPFVSRMFTPKRPPLIERFTKELDLSGPQVEKIAPLVAQAQQETQQLRRDNVRHISEVWDRVHATIAVELSPEQRVKQEEMRKRFRERAERLRAGLRERDRPATK